MDETKKIVTTDDIINKNGVLYDNIETPEGSLCLTKKVLMDSFQNINIKNDSLSENQLVPEDCINVINMGPFKIKIVCPGIDGLVDGFKLVQTTCLINNTNKTLTWEYFEIKTPYETWVERTVENTDITWPGNWKKTPKGKIYKVYNSAFSSPNETIVLKRGEPDEKSQFSFKLAYPDLGISGITALNTMYAVGKVLPSSGGAAIYYKFTYDSFNANNVVVTTSDEPYTFTLYFTENGKITYNEYNV